MNHCCYRIKVVVTFAPGRKDVIQDSHTPIKSISTDKQGM